AVIRRPTDAARVQQLAEIRRRGEFEYALVFGEERPLVADEGFRGAEVHDQVVAFHLAEVRVDRGRELELAVRLPEDVRAGIAVTALADVVVQTGYIRSDGQQRLVVVLDLDGREVGEESRPLEARHGPGRAFAGGTNDTAHLDVEHALLTRRAHRRDVPGNQHFRRPTFAVRGDGVLPVAIPVRVEVVLVRDDGVVDTVGDAHAEVVARAMVAVEVDHDRIPVDRIFEVALHTLQGQ